jgi:hypothetical protein
LGKSRVMERQKAAAEDDGNVNDYDDVSSPIKKK